MISMTEYFVPEPSSRNGNLHVGFPWVSHLRKWRKTTRITLPEGLRQERWLQNTYSFSCEDDNTSITRQCRPHFSPNPFCPPLWTKHIAFLMPGRLCSRWYRNPSCSIMLCKQTDLSCWCSCLLVLEYSEFCKWLWQPPDTLAICEVKRNKIQLTKL